MECVGIMVDYEYFKKKDIILCSFYTKQLKWLQLMMLQVVIYYIVTMILTKEVVIATDQCTEYISV